MSASPSGASTALFNLDCCSQIISRLLLANHWSLYGSRWQLWLQFLTVLLWQRNLSNPSHSPTKPLAHPHVFRHHTLRLDPRCSASLYDLHYSTFTHPLSLSDQGANSLINRQLTSVFSPAFFIAPVSNLILGGRQWSD